MPSSFSLSDDSFYRQVVHHDDLLAKLRFETDDLSRRLASLERDHNNRIGSLEDRMDAAELDISSLQSDVLALQAAPPAHTHAYSSLTSIPSTFAPSTHGDAAHNALSYASPTHNHDTAYSPILHDNTYHNPAFAEASHNHDSSYATASHNHDTAYASLSHNHSGVYSSATHVHSYDDYTPTGGFNVNLRTTNAPEG